VTLGDADASRDRESFSRPLTVTIMPGFRLWPIASIDAGSVACRSYRKRTEACGRSAKKAFDPTRTSTDAGSFPTLSSHSRS
jgi:hypothetical protein